MKNLIIVLILAFTSLSHSQTESKNTAVRQKIKLAKSYLEIVEHKPAGFSKNKKYPLLIIVPDIKDDNLDNQLYKKLAASSKRIGFYVLRFNWPFYSGKSKPSRQLKDEMSVLNEIIGTYAKKSFVKKGNVHLAAKNKGSLVFMNTQMSEVKSFTLISPSCNAKNTFKNNYKAILGRKKLKTHIVFSINDRDCAQQQIHSTLNLFKGPVSLYSLFGDSNFKQKSNGNKETQNLNQNTAIYSIVNFLSTNI